MSDKLLSVRISDGYLLRRIADEQRRSGDSTPTKTAHRLLIQKFHEIDLQQRDRREQRQPASSAA